MLNSIKLAQSHMRPFCPSLRSSRNLALVYTTSYNFSFNFNNFFNNTSKKKRKTRQPKPLNFSKSSKEFLEGFLKGPDFVALERSIALREADNMYIKGQECRAAKDYSQALTYYGKAAQVIQDYFDEDDPLIAIYYRKIGDVHQQREDLPKAIDSYKICLDVMIENPDEEEVKVAKMYALIGKCQMRERNYIEAIQNLHEALVIYQLNPEGNKRWIDSCHSKLAQSYLHIGKYEEALENFESLLVVKKQTEENPFFRQYYVNFAISLATAKQRYDEALLYIQKYLSKEISMNGGSSLSSANCYLKIGQIKTMQGRYKEAMEYYQKALEISKLIGGNNHKQMGSCFNAIGAVFLGQGKHKEAINYFKMALNCFHEKDFEIYACYKNIALTCFRQNKYDTALTNFEYSIEERSKLLEEFSEVDAESAALHGFLAALYVRKGCLAEGLEHYQRFMEIFFHLFYQQAVISYEEKAALYKAE